MRRIVMSGGNNSAGVDSSRCERMVLIGSDEIIGFAIEIA